MRGVSKWMGVALVPIVVGALVWWGLRPAPQAPAPAAIPSDHQRCQPLPDAPSGPPVLGPIAVGKWSISLAGARVSRTVPATDSDSYRAEAGRAFVVVDLALHRRDAGKGVADVRSGSLSVTCQDGMTLTPWGWKVDRGFCTLCAFDLGVPDRTVRVSLALKLDETWVDQPFEIRYQGVGPLRFRVPVP